MLYSISNGLAVLLLLAPLISALQLLVKREKRTLVWMLWFGLVSVGCYLLLVFAILATEWHLKAELAQFDLNGDGSFSGAELTPEMEEAMSAWTSDTGRRFAPFVGLVTCPVYSGFWHFIIGLPYLLTLRWKEE